MNHNKGPNSPFTYNYNYGYGKNQQSGFATNSEQNNFAYLSNIDKQFEYVPIHQPVFKGKTSQQSVNQVNSPQNKTLSVYSSKRSQFSDSLSIAQQTQNEDLIFQSNHQTYYKTTTDKLEPTVISNIFYKKQSNPQLKRPSSANKLTSHQQIKNSLEQKKLKYLQGIYNSFTQFERTQKIQIIKQFAQTNRAQMMKLYNQICSLKQNQSNNQNLSHVHKQNQKNFSQTFSTGEKMRKNSSQQILTHQNTSCNKKNQILRLKEQIQKEKRICEELNNDYNYELQIAEGRNLNASRMREENHLVQMNQTIKELDLQISREKRRSQQMSKEISHLPFYKEWNLMFEQSRGAIKLSVKLREELQKRLQKIKQLQKGANFKKSSSNQKLKTVIQVGVSKQTSRVKINSENPSNISEKSIGIGMVPIVRRENSREAVKRPASSQKNMQSQVRQNTYGTYKSAHKLSSSKHDYTGTLPQNKYYQTHLDPNLMGRRHQNQTSKTSLKKSRERQQNNLEERYKQNFSSVNNFYNTTNTVYGFQK